MYITQEDAQSIVNEMKASIHQDINIMDEHGVIMASTNPVRQGQLHRGALRVIQERLPALIIREDHMEEGVQRGINLPVVLEGRLEGVIGITGDPDEVSAFGDIIKRMTEIMLESARQREQMNLIEQAKSLFVENWLFSNEPDWAELDIRGRLLHMDMNAPYTVALLKLREERAENPTEAKAMFEMRSSLILRMVQSHLRDDAKHFCAVVNNMILVLLHRVDRKGACSKISSICQDIEHFYKVQISAGIRGVTRSPSDIRRCYAEAKTAVAIAEQSETGRVVFYDQVSLEFITQSIPASIKQELRKLIFGGCSRQEEAEFTQTIRLYFERNGNIQSCAEHLFIHRNTFQYRMDSIKRRTGYSLKIPKESILLYLAVQ